MTEPTSLSPIGDDDLMSWVDRRLPPARQAMVEAYLTAHPEVADRLARYREQDAALAEALRAKLEEPLPARLRVAPMLSQQRSRRWAWVSRVAALLLLMSGSAAGGWVAHRAAAPDPLQNAGAVAEAAYATFAVEVRHPVEVRADEGAHLAQWLSNRLDHPVRPPELVALGWRLMGGRLVPTTAAPAALLMYDDDRGTRLTVYVQPMTIEGEEFRYRRDGEVRTILWSENHLALAVTGRVSREVLLQAAQRVRAEAERNGS